jgi:hypothetical protein
MESGKGKPWRRPNALASGPPRGKFRSATMRAALIARQFDVQGRLVSVEPYGSGNVNDTYLAIFRTTFSEQRFIVQRVRKSVFPDPEAIMQNMRILTDHCHARLEAEADRSDRIWQLPKIIQTKNGEDWVTDADGDLWRAISQIASAQAHERVQNPEHAHEVGFVLGHFHRMVSDLEPARLRYALPGFHVTPGYVAKMDEALRTPGGQERLAASPEARRALRFVEERRGRCRALQDALDAGALRLRTTHGDPKVGNVMIDGATGRGTCIVDLDTVQPGLVHYDIGDATRSACNPAGEDAPDLASVIFDTDLFTTIYRGYLKHAKEFLSPADHRHLFDCVHLIPLELGVRFLADHLAGDVYFKVRHPGHNLRRALVQFKLTESIEAREGQIRKVLGEP